MKIIKPLILLLLLVGLLVWYFAQKGTQTDGTAATINSVSKQNNQANSTPAKSNTAKANTGETAGSDLALQTPNKTTVPKPNQERSYLNVYHEIRLSQHCEPYFQQQHEDETDHDFIANLDNTIKGQNPQSQGATKEQIATLEKFLNACFALETGIDERTTGGFDPRPVNAVFDALQQELNQVKPKTAAEKSLHQALNLVNRWQVNLAELLLVSKGAYALSGEERDRTDQSIKRLQQQIVDLYDRVDEVNQDDIKVMYEQIQKLEQQRDKRLPVDAAKRAQLLTAFSALTEQLEGGLFLGHPDTFLVTINALELTNDQAKIQFVVQDLYDPSEAESLPVLLPEFQTPSQQMMTLSGIPDQEIFNIMLRPTVYLWMCYLGDDCGPDSAYVRHHCLGDRFHRQNQPTACGTTLEDFYGTDYLSANQWQDVSALFDLMVDMYAP